MENTLTEMKNTLKAINNKVGGAKDQINDF